ncbi:hypothetical protein [Lewinella sp. W8]|uniref:hypothetical protein n=1 Tax=Lewinella sp. W8 TaxID=2528208 RepID=UPI001067EA28|nr:hypothetical protein [Lewinella sp. W8]MTB51719.1 hypothetical protein [Lewinella sp. W8]
MNLINAGFLSLLVVGVLGCGNGSSSFSCANPTRVQVMLPGKLPPKNLCDYYSWIVYYKDGKKISRDSSVTDSYCVPDGIDSVDVYANGNGYEIVDTSFRVNEGYTAIPIQPTSVEYFTAHDKFLSDVESSHIQLTTEDEDIEILDKEYGFMSTFDATISYTSWDVPGRDFRFTYNCTAENYFNDKYPTKYPDLPQTIDSLRYLELDQKCGSSVTEKDLLVLPQLANFNLDLESHTAKMLGERYQTRYLEELNKRAWSVGSIIDSVKYGKDYHNIRLAEIVGYLHTKDMVNRLIELISDTSFVGLTNSADLIYWERIKSGDLQSYGHGGVVFDDVFTVSGRANHLLYKITGTRLGNVRMKPSPEYLERLKCRWITYWDFIMQDGGPTTTR